MPVNEPDPIRDRLGEGETWWRDHQQWLDQCGYKLRPRVTPGWVPSWVGKDVLPMLCEDYGRYLTGAIQDATRKDNSQRVMLKVVDTREYPGEPEIAAYFSSKELADIPENHCVPILETLKVPEDDCSIILIMPLLRRCMDPPFETIGEVVEFLRQVFDGMRFMHRHRIAHLDCHKPNIMMDADAMYPNGFHPKEQDMSPDWRGPANHFSRTERPPRYYFIDFGISVRFQLDDPSPRTQVTWGGDYDRPPEILDRNAQCDPFPVDVFYMGNLIKHNFTEGSAHLEVEKKFGFKFLERLAADMTDPDPLKRPTMDEVVTRYTDIRRGLSSLQLRQRVVGVNEFFLARWYRNATHWGRTLGYVIRRIPPVPNQK